MRFARGGRRWRGEGRRQAGRTGAGGGGGGTVATVFALHPQHLPCRPPPHFESKHRETSANVQGWQAAGKVKEAARGHGQGSAPISPPSSQKGTPRSHAVLRGPGMTLRSMSPLVNVSFSFPISTESSTIYLLPVLAAIIFPHALYFLLHSGQEKFSGRSSV